MQIKVPVFFWNLPLPQIKAAAMRFGIEKEIIAAIVMTESGGNPMAVRYEPNWKYFYYSHTYASELKITYTTEEMLQASSYGLMQIMGSVARELGFKDHLGKLFDVELNLEYGCRKVFELLKKYDELDKVIASYNAGSPRYEKSGKLVNEKYVITVNNYLSRLRGE